MPKKQRKREKRKTTMTTVEVLLSVQDDYLEQMPALVEKLRAAGLRNIQSLAAIGIITGAVEETNLADLALIEGIAQVQRSQEHRLPPEDAAMQ